MSTSAAYIATSACLEAFGALRSHVQAAKPELAAQVSDADIEDEFGRFRLWAANIGALSRGHGSLDYRLRDAPVVLEGALKLLNELRQELHQMYLVLSGARLPYEAQTPSCDDSDVSSLSSRSESSSDSSSEGDNEKPAPNELRQRVAALSDINDNLYRLSRSIRAPASHSRSLKALSHKPVDPQTGVDILQQFAIRDTAFTEDLFAHLRRNAQDQYGNCPKLDDADMAMIKRFAQGITRRRQQFLYWKAHRKKLGFHAEKEMPKIPKPAPTVQLKGDEPKGSVVFPHAPMPVVGKAQTESSRPKTTVTETTATLFIAPTTVPDGNQSVTSYATTARGLDGSRIEFPKLPKSIKNGKDFECPYCLMICPPHYQMPRAWRAHLLRDLRPYMCTYQHCHQSDELFATKQDWLNHEHTHQKSWQCPEHASTNFATQDGLKGHLLAEPHESLQRMDLDDLLAICETDCPDSRTICPICFVDAGSSYGLENHLANHLERFAAFALPRDVEGEADEESADDSNMSDHAIARSDQSDVSDASYAFVGEDKKAEITALARKMQGISLDGFDDDTKVSLPSSDKILDKLYSQMMTIVNLPTEILDKLNIDLQFKAVFKTIPKLLIQLEEIVVAGTDEDGFRECASLVIFQRERLDSILQEYAVDFALDSSHPRLGMDTVIPEQSQEDSGRKHNQADPEAVNSRDSSPDSVVSRKGPRLSTMDLNSYQTPGSVEDTTASIRDSSPDSIVHRTDSILSTMDLNRFETSNQAEDDASSTRDSRKDGVVDRARTSIDAAPEETESESFCRKQLTTYEVYTIFPNTDDDGDDPQDDTTIKKLEPWAKVRIRQEFLPTEMIIKEIQKLDAGELTISEKMDRLYPRMSTQATNIIDSKLKDERDSQFFKWKIIQLHRQKSRSPTTGKNLTTSITVYLERAPHLGIDVVALYRERKEQARIRVSQATETDPDMETKPRTSDNKDGDKLTELTDEPPDENIRGKSPPSSVDRLKSSLLAAKRIKGQLDDLAAKQIKEQLHDLTTEDKVTPNAIVRLHEIFSDIYVGIEGLIATIGEEVPYSDVVMSIEATDARCLRLFEDASGFLEKYKKGTRPSWDSRKEYRDDVVQLWGSAQRALQEIHYVIELDARGRNRRPEMERGQKENDEPIFGPATETSTPLIDITEAIVGEHEQRPDSSNKPREPDSTHIPGPEDDSEVGHEPSELSKLIASQRDSSGSAPGTTLANLDVGPGIRGRPIIIDERPIKGILKPGRGQFPEDPSPTREGVAPLGDNTKDGIYLRPSRAEGAPPQGARWTKINRLLVNPQALVEGGERFEERDDFVIVLRVLSKEEIQKYADATAKIRAAREVEDNARDERRIKRVPAASRGPEQDGSDGDDEGNNSEYERSDKRKLARLRKTQKETQDTILTEEEEFLLHLRSEQELRLGWTATVEEFNKHTGKNYHITALQVLYLRLRNRLRVRSEKDDQSEGTPDDARRTNLDPEMVSSETSTEAGESFEGEQADRLEPGRAQQEEPEDNELAGYYYGYTRPPNRELAPIQQTLRGGGADGGVDIVDESRWTKINRRFVSPAALDRKQEKYDEWDHRVIVHRMLSREEVDAYAETTTSIRAARSEDNEEVGNEHRRRLYVNNLPIDASEDELKALFSKQRGYKRMYFRTKENGPMCFVEFEDVSFSTEALLALDGHLLHNSVKEGIRLSFPKYPLGVRSGQGSGRRNRDMRTPSPPPQPPGSAAKREETGHNDESIIAFNNRPQLGRYSPRPGKPVVYRGMDGPSSHPRRKGGSDVSEPGSLSPQASEDEISDWDDVVILNPHTLPRADQGTSPTTERNANSSQPVNADKEEPSERFYPSLPPLYPPLPPVTPLTTYPCTFAFAGCSSSFTSKDYWKRHVANNHMSFVHWECPLKPCPRPLLHTADLLERHLIMVHEPPDDEVAALVNKGKRPGRSLIEEISCPAPGCSEKWKLLAGMTWDERMEHVAKHWEAVARGEEPGGWTEEGGGLLEWAIREGAVTELGDGRLMWEQALGVSWELEHGARWPKESKGERKPTYDDASNLEASYITPSQLVEDDIGRRSFNFGGDQGGYTSQPMSRDGEKKATGRGEGKLPVRFVSGDEEESHRFSRPRHDDDDKIRQNSVLPSPRTSLDPIYQHSDGNPTTRHFLDRKETSLQKNRDGENKFTGSDTGATTSTTPPRTEVPREPTRLLKRISDLTKAFRVRSVRDVAGPAPRKATPGDEKRKSTNPILALPRLSSVSRSSAAKGDDADDDGEFPDLPPAGLRMSSPLKDTLDSDEPIPPMGQPMDAEVEEQLSRLKRRFSSKNWTEKGRGEQKAKEKGKGRGVVDATKQANPSINASRDIGDVDQSTPPQVSRQASLPRPMPVCWDHGCDGRKFSTYENLLRHQQEMAGVEPKPTCPECGEEFSTEMKRNEHMVECMKGDGKALARFIEEGAEKAERENARKEREVLRSVRSASKEGTDERVNYHDRVTEDAERWNSLQLSSDKAHAVETLSRPKPQCWDHGCNGREFKTYDHLLQHQKQMAGEAASPTCPRCLAEFANAEDRNRHMVQGKCEQEGSAEPADSEGRGGRVDDDERPVPLIRSSRPFTHDSWRPLHPPLTVCWDHGCDGRDFSNFASLAKHRREMADVELNPICGKCGSDLSNPMERERHTGQYCKARGSMDSTTEYIQKNEEMKAMKILEAVKREEVMKREDAIKREEAIERGKAGETGEGTDREGSAEKEGEVEGKKGRDGRVDDDEGLAPPIRSSGSSEDDTWYPLYPKPTVWGPQLQEGRKR